MRKFLFLLLFIPAMAFGQTEVVAEIPDTTFVEDTPTFEEEVRLLIASYQDSLHTLRRELDEALKTKRRNYSFDTPAALDGRYASLFLPLNFDRSLSLRRFASDELSEGVALMRHDIDDAMLHQFIFQPDNIFRSLERKKDAPKRTAEETAVVPKVADKQQEDLPTADEVKVKQQNIVVTRPNFWTFSGDYNLQFMQTGFSKNWSQGGESNYNVETWSTLRLNYNNKQKVKLDNTLEMRIGFRTNKGDTVHSVKPSSDQLRYTGRLGFKAAKRWDYTLQLIASSQFMRNHDFNSKRVTSDFLSPLTMNLSVGMAYNFSFFKGKFTGTANFAPLSGNYKYVDRPALRGKHGIEEGKSGKLDYGSSITITYDCNFSKSFSWHSRFYFYTPYERVDLQWENTFTLRVSKYITAKIYLYPRFDDSNPARKDRDMGYFQLKEFTSLGLSYQL